MNEEKARDESHTFGTIEIALKGENVRLTKERDETAKEFQVTWTMVTEKNTTIGLLQVEIARLRNAIMLAEHKVDQHLQGQYNYMPYPALGVALSTLRSALNPQEKP